MNEKKHALVTGGSGFIGSHLVESLLQRGYRVRCLVRENSNLQWIDKLSIETRVGDITAPDTLPEALDGIDHVFHLGGATRARDEAAYYRINAEGTANLVHACLDKGLKRFVYVSSLAAGGPSSRDRPRSEDMPDQPLTWYGKSKLEGEKIALGHADRIPVTVLRPPAVYGPREKDIFFYFQMIQKRVRPSLGFRKKYLSFVYVADLVEAIAQAAEKSQSIGQLFYVSDGEVHEMSDIAEAIATALEKKTVRVVIPNAALSVVSFFAELFSGISGKAVLLNRQKIVELKQSAWTCSDQKIRSVLGFEPTFNLDRGIDETATWYRTNQWL